MAGSGAERLIGDPHTIDLGEPCLWPLQVRPQRTPPKGEIRGDVTRPDTTPVGTPWLRTEGRAGATTLTLDEAYRTLPGQGG